ncbi:patatin-like phospholipase family protein [Mesobacillus harenae]|uniref:patatin-like phospholipase family protein n=1 Tax=Mesobacillus harenae TaxID=2213203 RepID=UPI001580E19B|nr:patatin family protein [Mesobacillus harenae]
MNVNSGLVLEGGGMRGVYTAGVLEYFLEHDITFPYVIGVSAGAANAASYLSMQKGRNKKVNIGFVSDSRYISWKNLLKKRQVFGMDFIFDEIPNKLVPYHYDVFYKNNTEFVIGTTDCLTGKPVYYRKEDYRNQLLTLIRASSSLPFIAPEVIFQSKTLLDGGISDPIPIQQSERDGNERNVVVLTRNDGYFKKPSRFHFLLKRKYPMYKGLQEAIALRHQKYNTTIQYLMEQERQGKVLIIRPSDPIKVGRIEKDPVKLENLYNLGYKDAERIAEKLVAW